MSMFDTVEIEEGIDLPELESNDEDTLWQTKTIDRSAMDSYKLTSDGRLLKEFKYYREKTDKEKLEEAETWGYDSWDELYDDWKNTNEFREDLPVMMNVRKLNYTEWNDVDRHGSFEIHETVSDYWHSYEVRFTNGNLDSIILLEKRSSIN